MVVKQTPTVKDKLALIIIIIIIIDKAVLTAGCVRAWAANVWAVAKEWVAVNAWAAWEWAVANEWVVKAWAAWGWAVANEWVFKAWAGWVKAWDDVDRRDARYG